jgi:DNA polymerase-3 subunit epsilon
MRQIILDTETTGISVDEGHRIIEIGCLEMINRRLTGKQLQYYLNPQREVEAGALAVHGITNEFLQNKPLFTDIAQELIGFIDGAELIIHNAPFDISFLDHELNLTRSNYKKIKDYCSVIDTLKLARQIHVGQRNSLDALCKRYGIDNSKRDLHGALMDAHLLTQVYLAMTGGQGSFFDQSESEGAAGKKSNEVVANAPLHQHELTVIKANEDELSSHEQYLELMRKKGKCLWKTVDGIEK